MTSEEDDTIKDIRVPSSPSHSGVANKRRKLARACDPCRRRKIKCDAPDKQEGEECSACVLHTRNCTFVEGAKRRGPPIGYVRYIEYRMDRLEAALKLLAPAYDIESNFGPRHTQGSWTNVNHQDLPHPSGGQTQNPASTITQTQTSRHFHVATDPPKQQPISSVNPIFATGVTPLPEPGTPSPAMRRIQEEPEGSDSSEEGKAFPSAGYFKFQFPEDDLPDQLSKLQLGGSTFLGKSANIHILHQAMSLKNEVTGRKDGTLWPTVPVERKGKPWGRSNPWASAQPSTVPTVEELEFPPEDLSDTLMALYFQFFHPFYPTLHRPSFEAQINEGLHKKYLPFGLQFLLVCAVGSRWSVDSRVCKIPDIAMSTSVQAEWRFAGWPYFSQVIRIREPFSCITNLPDLQNTFLLGFFALSSEVSFPAWLVAGHGVRFAMDFGAHRQKAYRQDRPLQNEVWKRTFWCLVNLDRISSNALGRTPAVNDEDIDVDLPLDANDNSWDESLQSWKPNNSLSRMQYFIHSTKLYQITTFAMRTLYSINKSRDRLGLVGEGWDRRIMSEIDSALNNWADNIPDHLRWDPNIAEATFFDQAVALNVGYYHAQMVIHRRFLPGSSKKPSSLAFTSLAICTNAARSISHIVDAHLKSILAGKYSPSPEGQHANAIPINPSISFLAGVVLFISIWRTKREGGNVDVTSLADDIQKILRYLEYAQERHPRSGKLVETLRELASVGEFPLNLDGDNPARRSAAKRAQTDTYDGVASSRGPQTVYGNFYQEPSSAISSLPKGTASTAPHLQTYGVQSTSLPVASEVPTAQSAPLQATDSGPMNSVAATGTPHLGSPNFFLTSESQLPWFNTASSFSPDTSTTTTAPISVAAPFLGTSDIAEPPDVESGISDAALTWESFYSMVPANGVDLSRHSNALETAYSALMENGRGAETSRGGALANKLGRNDAVDVPFQQALEPNIGECPQEATAGSSISPNIPRIAVDSPTASAEVDWESWISDNWGL